MIALREVSFRYAGGEPGVRALDLRLHEGECVVLCGASGCGKTTVTRLVNGLAPAYYPGEKSGTIHIAGEESAALPLWSIGQRVGSVFQDPQSQFFSSELEGEVAFACENYGYPRAEIRRRTGEAIARLGLGAIGKRPLDVLSGGEKQRTAIASVYALRPRIFVLDEPTANLDARGIAELRETLGALKAEGHGLLLAEHRLSWLDGLADRYLYMDAGRVAAAYTPEALRQMPPEERRALGLRATEALAMRALPRPDPGPEALLRAEDLSCARGGAQLWSGLNFALGAGQITALTGGNGMGKTTLALVLSGLAGAWSGRLYLGGRRAGRGALRRAVYYCANECAAQFFTDSVGEELLLGLRRSAARLEEARALLRRLDLYAQRERHPASLSGGQKQRLALACALLSERPVLILDEPTSGLDGGNMRLIAEELKTAARAGRCVMVISHDEEFVDCCCTHRIRLDEGGA